MVPTLDARYGVYVRNNAGDWTFNIQRFVAMLAREDINGWPVTGTGKLDMKDKVFREMAKAYPILEDLHQLRYTRNKMRKVKLAVGRDGRNRSFVSLIPTAHCQLMALRIIPVCRECCTQSPHAKSSCPPTGRIFPCR